MCSKLGALMVNLHNLKQSFFKWHKSSNCHFKAKKNLWSHVLPVSLTANTKGNKRSRTRTDSYTAGQSVGESAGLTSSRTASCVQWNDIRTCLNLWLCCHCRGPWGNRPRRDHTQETGDHSAWVYSLLQWVSRSSCWCRTFLHFSALHVVPRHLAIMLSWVMGAATVLLSSI